MSHDPLLAVVNSIKWCDSSIIVAFCIYNLTNGVTWPCIVDFCHVRLRTHHQVASSCSVEREIG